MASAKVGSPIWVLWPIVARQLLCQVQRQLPCLVEAVFFTVDFA